MPRGAVTSRPVARYGAAMMRAVLLIACLFLATPAVAQINCNEGLPPIDNDADSRMGAPDFIRQVMAKEAVFAKAISNFAYNADVTIQTLDGDKVDGELRQLASIGFNAAGSRVVTRAAPSAKSLKRLSVTAHDLDVLTAAPPFALTTDSVADRDAVYSGRQQVADHNTAVFDLLPRNEQAPFRGFAGRTWVWTAQNTVLKTCGRYSGLPIGPMRWEMQRVAVGDNWFPLWLKADETLRIGDSDVHVRVVVQYAGYKAR